ncbi:MAG: DNA polymerase I [Oscillospiraceae bacterium]|nr:DNA polymerase I [Oscillospiraceae bacterium]
MKLLVLDGNSILNRAFYGIKLLTTKDGRYTNAIFGFLSMYLALRDQAQPDGIAVAFDVKAPTFRHEMYDGYKAQRKGMPPELAEQLPVLKELLAAMGLCVLECPGWEADDILGTLAYSCTDDDCILATGDRDALQLVNDRVQVWLAKTKETLRYTPALVQEEYGLTPAQLIDLKALMGDSSDNIPGVAGVGQKTAQALMMQFGTLENIYANLDDASIKAGVRAKLETGRDSALLSRELGTIARNAPICCDLAGYVPKPPDAAKVTRMMAELEMFRLLERLDLPAVGTIAPDRPQPQRPLIEEHDLPALLARLGERVHFTAQFSGDLLEGITIAQAEQDSLVLCGTGGFFEFVKALLESPCAKYCDDSKALWRWALQNGVAAQNIAFDVALAGYLLNPGASGYDAARLLQEYACGDFAALCGKLEGLLREQGQWALYHETELPLARVLAQMELHGFAVDAVRITAYGEELGERIDELTREIIALAGGEFNLNSPKQLGEVLFERLGLRPPKKTKTGYSTNAEVLEELRSHHPIVGLILDYRVLQKLKSTYCDGLLKVIDADGRVRSTLNQTETRTGRISSSEPNLQNIPIRRKEGRQLRQCFVAAPGHVLVMADYSQIELRVMAAMAQETTMIAAFAAGEDIHTATAAQVFGMPTAMVLPEMRSQAKAVNFGIIYGIGAFSLAKDIGVTMKEAKEYIDGYFAHYPKVQAFRQRLIDQATERGYAESLFGRRRALPELASSQRQLREFGQRVAVNMPVQGTAADIIKMAMVRVASRLASENLQARLILQVHDELIIEAPADEAQQAATALKQEMESAAQLAVPMLVEVKVGQTWEKS